jgi:hypothetical protein
MTDFPYVEFITNAGACLTTRHVTERTGRIRWLVRQESAAPADNGWRSFSHLDDADSMSGADSWQMVAFNQLCAIEPALIGIYDLPVGSDLQIVDDGQQIRIVETATGRELGLDELYTPGQPVRDWGERTPRSFDAKS